jgi:tRNA pseudouridine(38-40) synthase
VDETAPSGELAPEVGPHADLRRVRLDVAYDGGNFLGWSAQPGLRTVQGELDAALAVIFGKHGPPGPLTVAGRTDAGVHATGQVAHLDITPAQLKVLTRPRGKSGEGFDGPQALGRRLNGIAGLNADIFVSRGSFAPPGFDARFSAIWRSYEYRVADASAPRNPLLRNHTLWYPAVLDLGLLNAAADALVGLHDWAAFCKPREGATTVRDLEDFRWTRRDRHRRGRGQASPRSVDRGARPARPSERLQGAAGEGPHPHRGRIPAGCGAPGAGTPHPQPTTPDGDIGSPGAVPCAVRHRGAAAERRGRRTRFDRGDVDGLVLTLGACAESHGTTNLSPPPAAFRDIVCGTPIGVGFTNTSFRQRKQYYCDAHFFSQARRCPA